ncbi:hypothetical protein H1R20_g12697, partial [Candolleomyces eurysporus]
MLQQGLGNRVNCVYTDTSPITFDPSAASDDLQYQGACGNGQTFMSVSSGAGNSTRNGLAFLACKGVITQSPEAEDPTYYIYLRGGKGPGYSTFVGNITCTVSPMRSEVFAVTYRKDQAYFKIDDPAVNPAPAAANLSTHPAFIESAFHILGELVSWGQRWNSNMIAESVAIFGVKLFQIPQVERHNDYLELYAATIQGVLEYVATYLRLHLLQEPPPSSCFRNVEGSVDYTVMGWSTASSYVQIAFLLPMTILNLTTLVIFLAATYGGSSYTHDFEPTDTRSLLGASVGGKGSKEGGDSTAKVDWGDRVTYQTD